MAHDVKTPYGAWKAKSLSGEVAIPGDKSISHRALIFALLAVGRSHISGLLEGDDVLATADAVRALGGHVERLDDGRWRVDGVGVGALQEPEDVLDMGNSGTAARLLVGLVAGHPITTFFTGDESLRGRPMARVTSPLSSIGARFMSRRDGRLPLCVHGVTDAAPLDYELPVASAQVKSAMLLAALNLPGVSRVVDPFGTRDHTENMLRHFGAQIDVDGHEIRLTGQPELMARDTLVPGDPSSASFPAVAALIVPGSRILLKGVGMNPTRTGLFTVLKRMGAKIESIDARIEGGEPVADLSVSASNLKGVNVEAEIVPHMVDEFPILAVAAANATGDSVFHGLEELRVKESDRLAAIANGLKAIGVKSEIMGDILRIEGCGPGKVPGGGPVTTHFDHRIAMSFLVAGLAARKSVHVDDGRAIATSFPNFFDLMRSLGAEMTAV